MTGLPAASTVTDLTPWVIPSFINGCVCPIDDHVWTYGALDTGVDAPPTLYRRGPAKQRVNGLALNLDAGFTHRLKNRPAKDPKNFPQRYQLAPLRQWCQEHPDVFRDPACRPEVVCWAGLLKTIMLTPAHLHNPEATGWIVLAWKIEGTLYLAHVNRPAKPVEQPAMKKSSEKDNEDTERYSFWGQKFEQCLTHSNEEANFSDTSADKTSYIAVRSRRINGIKVLFGAEIDCRDPDGSGRYVELKTTSVDAISTHQGRSMNNAKNNYYRFKMLSWWAQCYIAAVPKVLVGYRTADGCCVSTDEFYTDDLPAKSKAAGAEWNCQDAINFLGAFLDKVKKTVKEDYTKNMYTFEWSPGTLLVKINSITKNQPKKSSYCETAA
ncbi:decapping and exoribonuclease protein-like [Paramacrobiotus metropolitanus]|uniref:decapping and exoribonuclease protein-like n=1 Tax=Paramacrobiotus metropolitanus TaxID=2943436 RepID=UPI00244597D1|nr:decapping and exoribonuclease protein-like [Paramacrobiotus metropolitanus]